MSCNYNLSIIFYKKIEKITNKLQINYTCNSNSAKYFNS